MATEKLQFTVKQNKKYGEYGVFTYQGHAKAEFQSEMFRNSLGFLQRLMSDETGEVDEELITELQGAIEDICNMCSRFSKKYPDFLQAYTLAGLTLRSNGETDASMIWLKRAVDVGMALIPEDFKGVIPLGEEHNNAFLMAQQLYVLALDEDYIESRDYMNNDKSARLLSEAAKLYEWTGKSSNLIRELLVNYYTALDQPERAITIMKEDSAYYNYAPFVYNQAYIHFCRDEYVEALTKLRQAFLMNPYIAEMLLGNPEPEKKPFIVYSGDEQMNEANRYNDSNNIMRQMWVCMDLYKLNFMNWAYNCPQSLRDRADYAEISERAEQSDFSDAAMKQANREVEAFINQISDDSSKKCQFMHKLNDGSLIYKWEYEPDDEEYEDEAL